MGRSLEEKSLNSFRVSLLLTLLKMVVLFSVLTAIFSLLKFFPLERNYTYLLFVYTLAIFSLYLLLKRDSAYYTYILHISMIFSLFIIGSMSLHLVHDEFRFVWFFLIAFSAFILGGKRYGFLITLLISLMVLALYLFTDVHLSLFAVATFYSALFIFTLFAYYFLKKIESDSNLLQERVKEEIAKQQLQEQMLLQKYRMANMGEMIDTIAHQWRQPLIQSNMILLNMDDGLDDDVEKTYLKEKIVDLSRLNSHMSQTIDDFRELLSDGKKRIEFDMNDVVDEVLRVMKNSLRDVTVHYEEGENFSVLGYKNELMQVIITLLSNALEALKNTENPTIIIEVNVKKRTLSIKDNAGGVKPKVIEKIFDPYFTTKEQSGGTGLGLYVSKIIIEQNMQGKLMVVNEKEGAKFSIVFGEEK